MITILQGTDKELYSYVSKKYSDKDDLIIYGTKDFGVPFLIFRGIVPFLRSRIGDAKVDQLLFSYKTYISVIYNHLTPYLDEDQKKLRLLSVARLDSHITHSTVAKSAITKSCAEIILKLYKLHKFQLIIPDLTHLDVNSLDLLKFMYQVYPKKSPNLVLGYNPEWENDNYDKALGISWYYSLDTVTILQSFVYSFEGISSVSEKINSENTINNIPSKSFEIERFLDKYDDSIEWNVYNIINHGSSLDREKAAYVIKGIKKCFQLFDFTNAMLLSMKAQKALAPFISDEEKAILFHIIGLCAHNRHFFTQGNIPLANYLHKIFKNALKYEIEPSRRIAILYRLIVTLSRRKNDLTGANLYVNQAYEELNGFSGVNKKVLLAWINNVHSYMLMKEGNLTAAIEKHEDAYYLLDKAHFDPLYISKDEVNYTKAVLAENLSTLNSLRGDFDKMEHWYKIETFYTDIWPSLNAVSYAEWQSYYYQQLKITQALSKAKQGLKKTKQSFNYILEYFFTLSLADINNRLGNISEALAYYKKSLIFHKNIGHSYSQITFFALQMALLKLAIKSKRYKEAIALIEELKTTYVEASLYDSIEIIEQLALCYAHLGEADEAEKHINLAIDMALKDGNCSILFKVTLAAAKVCQVLKRKREAKDTYLQALEISKTVVDGVAFKASKPDLSTLYLGVLECGKTNTHFLIALIKNLSDSLKKNIDSWWDLKRVLRIISVLPIAEKNAVMEATQPFYKTILEAASQRTDCHKFLNNYAKEKLHTKI